VPAQQRLRRNQETGPAGLGHDAADGGEQRAVGGLQAGTRGLATQDGELVAQDEDLQVLGGIAAGQQHEQLEGPAQHEVRQFRQHPDSLRGSTEAAHYRAALPCEPAAHLHRMTLRTPQALASRRGDTNTSITWPNWSIAR
jgi:hypothetical protein